MCGLYLIDENGQTRPVDRTDAAKPRLAVLKEWGATRKRHHRVAETTIGNKWISTVFLGMDHQYGDGPPLLFETMIRCGDGDWEDYQERYDTIDAARLGHETACEMVRSCFWWARLIAWLKRGT